MRPHRNSAFRQPQSTLTVGFYSPLPPAPTGVADYSAALLEALRHYGKVEIASSNCDSALYHVGNNQLHQSIYEQAIRRPGIVVLHDAVLQHFHLGSFSQQSYRDEFAFNYGNWNRHEADTLWRDRAVSAQDPRYFARPMLKRIAEASLAIVVHNQAAARIVREHAPMTVVQEIPHFYQPAALPPPNAISTFRQQLGIPPNGFVFAIFGFLRESKRLLPVLRAFLRLRQLAGGVHLLVAGQFVSQDLEQAAAPLIQQPGIHRLPHLPENQFQIALASADCCLNLRYPTAQETSGIAMRMMGSGKPVIVTDGEEWVRFAETSLFRIPAGPCESEALFEAMAFLSRNPEQGRQMGLQAAEHIQRYHSLSGSAAEYWKLLCGTLHSQSGSHFSP